MSRDKNQISLLHFYILKKNQTPRVPKFLNNLWKMWIINNICHYNCFIHAYFASDLSCFSVNQILFRSCSWLWVRSLVIWLLWEGEIFRRIKYILLDATGNKGRKNHLSSHNVLFVNFWEGSTLSATISLSLKVIPHAFMFNWPAYLREQVHTTFHKLFSITKCTSVNCPSATIFLHLIKPSIKLWRRM